MRYLISLDQFSLTLPTVCRMDTAAAGGQGWVPENPLWGHCAVAALLVQALYGGDLLRVSLLETEFAASQSHYFNLLPQGTWYDATEGQFAGRLQTKSLRASLRDRAYVIGGADTASRYALLKFRFLSAASR